MRYDKDKHWIYVAVHNKYSNNILPQLPQLLSTYLLLNPDIYRQSDYRQNSMSSK